MSNVSARFYIFKFELSRIFEKPIKPFVYIRKTSSIYFREGYRLWFSPTNKLHQRKLINSNESFIEYEGMVVLITKFKLITVKLTNYF